MISIKDKIDCVGCNGCFNICGHKAITMVTDNEGFRYPSVDINKCTDCGLCEKVCPVIKPLEATGNETEAYAFICNSIELRKESSSGGAFSLIAEYIINQGGVVFGASWGEDLNVYHRYVDNIEDLHLLRGSKYVQSDTSDTFRQVRTFLRDGRKVLFCGTPCQVNGLLKFVGNKNTENLYTCDFVCHGVPSPKVWRKYLDYVKSENSTNDISAVSHRDKKYGWKTSSLSYKINIGDNTVEKYSKILTFDKYLQTFLRNVSLRPACYFCKFKEVNRPSDITLADFWGIRRICPKMNNDTGVSLCMVHSEKGKELFDYISTKGINAEVDINKVAKINENMLKSCIMPESRTAFFENLDSLSFGQLYKKYVKKGLVRESLNTLKGWTKILLHCISK